MAYLDEESPLSEKVIIGVIITAACSVVWKYTPVKEMLFNTTMTPAATERAMMNNPNTAPLFQEMKADFPEDFSRLVAQYSNSLRTNEAEAIREENGSAFLKDFIASKVDAIAHAPDSALVDVAIAQSTFARQAQKSNVPVCAAYATTGLSLSQAKKMNLDEQTALAAISRYILIAAHEGETAPMSRDRDAPSATDQQALATKVRSFGLTGGLERLLTSPEAVASASEREQCDLGVLFSSATAALEPSMTARFVASSLKASIVAEGGAGTR